MAWAPQTLAWLFTVAVCTGLALAFRADGWRCVALLHSFLLCLVLTQLSVHWVLRGLGFPYASFLTLLQFAFLWPASWLAAGSRNLRAPEADGGGDMRFCSWRFCGFYASRILPIALTIAVSVAANNASLGLIDPGLNALLGSMTPAWTAVLASLFGERHPRGAWLALLPATLGGLLALRGGLQVRSAEGGGSSQRQWLGVGLSLAAMLFRSLKTVFIERTVRSRRGQGTVAHAAGTATAGEPYPVLEPMQSLVLQTPCTAAVLLVLAALDPSGLGAPLGCLRRGGDGESGWLLLLGLALNLAAAGSLNLVGLVTVRRIGATAMQIVGKCNIFIVMAFSAAYNGETITAGEVAGAALVLLSAYVFSTSKAAESAGKVGATEGSTAGAPAARRPVRYRKRDWGALPELV